MDIIRDTKRWLYDLFLHDQAVKQEMGRAATAIGYGLNPEQYTRPFPGSNTNVVIQKNGKLLPLLGGLLLGVGGTVLGGLLLAKNVGVPLPVPGVEWPVKEFDIDWKAKFDGKGLNFEIEKIRPVN